jgi:hypothetical protein
MIAGTKAVSAQLNPADVARLQALAAANGYSLHRYLVVHLTEHARTAKPPEASFTVKSDANPEPSTEAFIVEIPLDLAQRLHSAARQMRHSTGTPVAASWLARQLVLHTCCQKSDILERIAAEVSPTYRDHAGFTGRTKHRAGKTWHPLTFYTTFDQSKSIRAVAKEYDKAMSVVVRKILDAALPPLPAKL